MSVIFFYQDRSHQLQGAGLYSWRFGAHLLPALIGAVNQEAEHLASISRSDLPDFERPFRPANLYRDEQQWDEVFFLDANEAHRLFLWCAYLRSENLTFDAYFGRLVDDLRRWTQPIEDFRTKPSAEPTQ